MVAVSLKKFKDIKIIFTMPNADHDSKIIFKEINNFVRKNKYSAAFNSLGSANYLSCYDLNSVKEIAKHSEVLVFLKDGRYFDKVIELLKESGFPGNSIFAIGQDLGTDHEIIRKMTLGEVNDGTLTTKYFSILVVKRV